MLRGDESNTKHALPQERKRAKGENDNETKVQVRSQVDHRPVSGPMRGAQLPDGNQLRRASVLLPSDKGIYGTRCGHGEKAERDFAAHRIDEDGY
jgi:hypothetical protein